VVLDLGLPAWSNLLRDGENVIAVEVHQDRTISSDLSFDLHLAATLDQSTGILANDIELDGQELTAILVAGPSHGALDFGSDGTFEYVPSAGFVGIDAFTYLALNQAIAIAVVRRCAAFGAGAWRAGGGAAVVLFGF
jgi:titin